MNKTTARNKLPYIGAILSLIPALMISIDESSLIISLLFILAIVLNILALKRPTDLMNTIINFINSGIMFVFAIDSLLKDKTYIQYAYFVAGVLFLIVAVRGVYKYRLTRTKH